MLWFFLALSTAFFTSIKDIFGKKALNNIDSFVVAWSWSFFTALFLLPVQLWFGLPTFGDRFVLALTVVSILNTIAFTLYIKAISLSDLSLTLPMIAFTPIFLLVTSPIILGEWPNLIDGLGVVTIVAGSYLLNLKERSRGYFAPFEALLREPGPKLTLLVAFIWSITGNFDKIGVQNSSPLFWVFAIFGTISCLQLPIVWSQSANPVKKVRDNLPGLSMMGVCTALAVFCQMQALQLTLVVQVISIKRTSVLMGVVWGKLFFDEQGIKERFSGTVTMLVGVALITLF
ncbi:EamA family transporter [Phormidium sp. CCY1219]|uniref:EamA family transporter n=1 Tax=Phormidium sp. CCY1219 TaxID=2886104 RepID=UPI002D1E9C49|nr:EamA family transporter [Phormidium sp. CCY1219]MEB3826336.1 DMT family transporter [Phormidium sp. CCY1219]